MAFTAKDVQALREKTGVGMMDCKKALAATDGDMDKAIDFLREKGLAAATKKASRIAAEGMVYPCYDADKKVGVVVEVNAETDFVAKNDKFTTFVKAVANTVIDEAPADVEALLASKLAGSDRTVQENLQDNILSIGENQKVRRFERVEGVCATYIHGGGSVGVLVTFDTDAEGEEAFQVMGKDVAMQIAAMNPAYLDDAAVPADVIEHEKGIILAQMKEDPKMANKPEKVLDGIVAGKIKKFCKENCLVNQEFVKNGDMTVGQYIDSVAKELGKNIKITGFVRYAKGEGLEKREDNFADEIAKMVN